MDKQNRKRKTLKYKLMIQALSPLALLTIIKNFFFIIVGEGGNRLNACGFIQANLPVLIVMLICGIWILFALLFLFSFKSFKEFDRKEGFEIKIIEQKEADSLNFFLALIPPLLIDDINTWQGLTLFVVLILLIWGLLLKTKLFYANPVLSLLGYYIAEISFKENKEKNKGTYIAISRGKLEGNHNIGYKDITDDVLFVKEMNNGNKKATKEDK